MHGETMKIVRWCILSFGWFPCVWILYVEVSEHTVYSFFIGRVFTRPMKKEQSVPKRRNIKFRRRRITQKKEYNIQNTAKVWNQESLEDNA